MASVHGTGVAVIVENVPNRTRDRERTCVVNRIMSEGTRCFLSIVDVRTFAVNTSIDIGVHNVLEECSVLL
jgi:hypothetical protein